MMLAVAAVSLGAGFAVAYTAETHAMLKPCNCPLEPFGGAARRATIIARLRKDEAGPLFVLDGGGFSAGGPYDEYTRGPRADAVRTKASARVLKAMGYDACCVGDEELALGREGLVQLAAASPPLLCANVRAGPLRPSIVIERGGVRLGVVGVVTDEAGLLGWTVEDAADAARREVEALRAKGVDAVLVVSHLGEEEMFPLARACPADAFFNAHSKEGTEASFTAAGKPVVQFDYQARRLIVARFELRPKGCSLAGVERLALGNDVPDEPSVAGIVREAENAMAGTGGERAVVVDAFLSPFLPGCREAFRGLTQLEDSLGDKCLLRVHFPVSEEGDRLRLGQTDREAGEMRKLAAMREFYPEGFCSYLSWRLKNPEVESWEDEARRAGILPARVKMSVLSGETDEFLRRDALLGRKLGAGYALAVYVNNREYAGPLKRLHLLRACCRLIPGEAKPEACRGVPECFADADCWKRGFESRCVDGGTPRAHCEREKAVRVELLVVEDSRAFRSTSEGVIDAFLFFAPGLELRREEFGTEQGRARAAELDLKSLPGYAFSKELARVGRFGEMRSWVEEKAGRYVVQQWRVGGTQLITRPRREGELVLFAAPFSKAAAEAFGFLKEAGAEGLDLPRVRFITREEKGELRAPGGPGELEEAARSYAVLGLHPGSFLDYLNLRAVTRGSSYWRGPLEGLGLDPEAVKSRALSGETRALLLADAREVRELGGGPPLFFLLANQELVTPVNRGELKKLLEFARKRP